MNNRKNKQAGFSLSETLITVLLLTIVLSAVTVGITAVRNSYKRIVLKADAMTLLSTIAVSMEADFCSATGISETPIELDDGQMVYPFKSGIRGYSMYFCNKAYDENANMVSVHVADMDIPVTTNEAHTSSLSSRMNYTYDKINGCFRYHIDIYERGTESGGNPKIITGMDYVTRPYEEIDE